MALLALQLVYVVTAGVLLGVALGLAHVIYRDAKDRGVPGSYPLYWAAGSVCIPFVIVPLYAYYAPRLGMRSRPVTARERWTVWLYGCVVTSIAVGAALTPPDPFTQPLAQAGLFIPAAVLFYVILFRGYDERFYDRVPGA